MQLSKYSLVDKVAHIKFEGNVSRMRASYVCSEVGQRIMDAKSCQTRIPC